MVLAPSDVRGIVERVCARQDVLDACAKRDGADGWITGRFQPSGDGYRAADLINVSAGAGDPGDGGVLQAVDRVRSQAQQAGAVGVDSGDSARLLKCAWSRSSVRGPHGVSRHAATVTVADNIHGLRQIRFPKGNISAKFEEIRNVLEREGIIPPQS